MPRTFRPYDPDQGLLLPPSLRDWLPENHLVFFISDAIDAMDLSAFAARYGSEGPGTQAEPPRVYRRLPFLRGWSHEQSKAVLPGGAGASGPDGV